jgi:hypothetical protein
VRSATSRIAKITTLACVLLTGCNERLTRYDGYRGDGTFAGHAAPSAICQDGYTVDLGAIDLSSANRIERGLEGLPHLESTIGLAIARKSLVAGEDAPRPSTLITVTLRDEKNHIVLSRQEHLSQWTRQYPIDDPQHAFLYQPGSLIAVPVGPDTSHVQRFPIGEDDSWGTYFTPRRGARYTLDLTVDEPDADSAAVDARLQIRGVVGCL